MIATAWAVTYCGATPVFVDCKDNLTIDETLIREVITPKTRAIMPVHIYGRQCNMDEIMKIAYEYNLYVVEDSAEAHGIKPRGDIACYSFFGNKIITTGEGGMCVTNDKRIHDQIQHIKAMAFDKDHTFLHPKLGYNFRMTNIQAAIGLAQVEQIDYILSKRKLIEDWYDHYLPENIVRQPKRDVVWMYDICMNNRDMMMKYLSGNSIETRYFFKPMNDQPMYSDTYIPFSKAKKYSKLGFYLPTYTELTEEEVKYICSMF